MVVSVILFHVSTLLTHLSREPSPAMDQAFLDRQAAKSPLSYWEKSNTLLLTPDEPRA